MVVMDQLARPAGFSLEWQMSRSEQLTFVKLLDEIRPRLALEIGTYKGGSLQVLSHFSERVISLDINDTHVHNLRGKFPNVEFRVGDSKSTLPELIQELNESGNSPDFVLVDGSHEPADVRADIDAILKLRPTRRVVIILHDSFNPPCRAGISAAKWNENVFVHDVDLDFLPGDFNETPWPGVQLGSMWGGFACALLEPVPRERGLIVRESRRKSFEAIEAISIYARKALGLKGLFSR